MKTIVFLAGLVLSTSSWAQISQNPQDQLSPDDAARLQQQMQQSPRGVRITNTQNSSIDGPVTAPRQESPLPPGRDLGPPGMFKVPEPVEDNEFQNFVAQSVGKKLPIFGQSLFSGVPSTFAPVDRIPVSANYILGPGDELLIRAWGAIDIDYRALVDRNGNIYIPRVGTVSVAGLQYEQLQPYLKTAVGKFFRNFDLSVNIGQLRSVQIFVVGQARHPGSYTVSSLSTLVNAVFASAGPSSKGSMRHIQLKRSSQVVTDFDLYDLISRGDKSKDVPLLPGDVIYIAPVGPLVALFGSVNSPAIYELKQATTLGEAIQYAGGLTTTASGQKAVIERIDEHRERSAAEFTLDSSGLNQPLKDGDIVRFIPISPRFENAVTLRGNVALPGRYPWRQGMRIRDLIPDKEALVVRSYWETQNSLVKDSLSIKAPRSQDRQSQDPAGGKGPLPVQETPVPDATPMPDVQSPEAAASTDSRPNTDRGTAEHVNQRTLGNEIKRNAPDINWDYAVIQRLNLDDLTTKLIPFNLGKAILEKDAINNRELEPGDIVTIFSQADLRVPLANQSKFVRLEGEFKAAGIYRVEPGESLHHLVERAGGLTENAYLFGSDFTRESTREDQQKRLDQYIIEMERAMQRSSISATNRAPSVEEGAALKATLENQRRLIDILRQSRATGRIVLALKPESNSVDALPDLSMEDGDKLTVPYRPATVQVLGTVYNSGAFLHADQKRLADYLRLSGGPTKDADKNQIFVIRADGSVIASHQHTYFSGGIHALRMMPGDTIVVPENLTKGSFVRNMKDIAQILGQFGLAAAAVNVLK